MHETDQEENPKAAGKGTRVEDLSPERRALLASLLRKKRAAAAAIELTIPRRPDSDSLPLSFAQQRLWFLEQWGGGEPLYNLMWGVRASGELHPRALEQSLREIVRRHEVLRTTFVEAKGVPAQVIHESTEPDLTVLDLRGLPEAEREARVRAEASDELHKPFDLATGPLLRVRLLWTAENEHVLLLSMHHIVSDGWSLAILIRELSALYEAHAGGGRVTLPELPVQYADYASWQRRRLTGERLDALLSYWRRQLAGAPATLNLPVARPASPSFRGASHRFTLSADLLKSLKQLSQSEDVTLFITLLAAFKALLYRYTGQEDIVVGSPIAGRNHREIEPLIGFFVNTLVLRTDLGGEPSFRELLRRVKEVALGAFNHQDLPFEKLVETLQPERSTSHTPLFDVMFVLQNVSMPEIKLAGLQWSRLPVESDLAKFDLTLTAEEEGGCVSASLDYNADLFDPRFVARLASHLAALLGAAAADPSLPIHRLPLLSAAERERLLRGPNQTGRRWDDDGQPLHRLFERRAAASPEACAADDGRRRVSYGELNAEANRAGRLLRGLGVGPETRVGVLMGRSVATVAALLGILKAGGVYVPLDPAHPPRRLRLIMEEARPRVLLTQPGLSVEGWGVAEGTRVLEVDEWWGAAAGESGEDFDSGVTADNLTYIIYTSGSTGHPKGVMISHRALVNYLSWCIRAYPVAEGIGAPVHSPLSFDLTVTSLFAPLLMGRRVLLVAEEEGVEGVGAALAREEDFSLVKITPAHLEVLGQRLGERRAGGRTRAFVIGGEALSGESLHFWQAHAPETRLINEYGPTEATVGCCVYEVEKGARLGGPVPIGRPIANVTLYVLDRFMNPVPLGVAGELYVGGAGLARGYLRRPDLTAERFIPDPFAAEPGQRLYRTGDLVRYLPDGNLVYLGRTDQQVKLRGYRIELGEIETALKRNDGVRECVAVVRADQPQDKRLVSYVVAEEAGADLAKQLRAELKNWLPEYMIPSAFVMLDKLPLTPNGKIDRDALPEPGRSAEDGEQPRHAEPHTPVEKILVAIWQAVLRLEHVETGDNFFESGGHSLLATQVISRARDAFGVELSLQDLFETPTVAGLAGRIETALRGEEALEQPVIVASSREEVAPLSFAQEEVWRLRQTGQESLPDNVSGATRLHGPLNEAALRRAVAEIVRRHEVLRTAFTDEGGQPTQVVVAPPSSFPIPLVDLRHLPEAEREARAELLAAEEASRPFDPADATSLRAALLRVGAQEHILLLSMQPIAADVRSYKILLAEVCALYEAHAGGGRVTLPELPVQYADYASWQRRRLTGERLDALLSYWRRQLAGAPTLTAAARRPSDDGPHGAAETFSLSRAVTDGLKELSRQESVTLFMTLLAAFQTLIHRGTGHEDIAVAIPAAGRARGTTERAIGLFDNTLLLRINFKGNPPFRELLWQVREVAVGAYLHGELPFVKLAEELQPDRVHGRAPLVPMMFALEDAPEPSARVSGLIFTRVTLPTTVLKAALTLTMREQAGQLTGLFGCNAALNATVAVGVAERFVMLLESILAEPDQPAAPPPAAG